MSTLIKRTACLLTSPLFACLCIGMLLMGWTMHAHAASSLPPLAAESQYRTITLGKGETAELIAQREHVSMDALARINQDFLPPGTKLEQLIPGQTLRVPTQSAKINALFIHGDEALAMKQALAEPSAASTAANQPGSATASQLGSIFESLGNALNSEADQRDSATKSSLAGSATDIANSQFNQSLGQELGKLGTARVNLGANQNMDFDGAEVSLLHPWFENDQRMVFSQTSVHREDGRTFVNLGVGQRHFLASGNMLGYNTFFDQDLSGHNNRVGVGAEAWSDNLKLSTNGYLGLTNWHDALDLDGYEERPANGYDVQLDGYLPSWPQLGGKLKYEKYYGDQVALFGNSQDDLQRNPSAVTLGLNYTPFPLMTVGVDYTTGQGGKHAASLNLAFNIQLGESLAAQLNPDRVKASRSVKGSKHDFVTRNNKIVMEYRKKDHISLSVQPMITGKARSTQTVAYSVSAQSGVASVDFQSPELVAAGGVITMGDGQFSLTLPPLLPTNTYTLTGTALSQSGTKSDPAISLVSVVSPVKVDARLALSVLPAELSQTTKLSVHLTDTDSGQPYNLYAQGGQLDFKVVRNDLKGLRGAPHGYTSTQVSAVSADKQGQVSALVTAGNQPGTATIEIYAQRPNLPEMKIGSVDLTLQPLDASSAKIDMNMVRDHALADGHATDAFSLKVTDAAGLPMLNQAVYLSDAQDADAFKSINPVYPDQNGSADVAFSSAQDGTHTISASFDNGGASKKTLNLSFSTSLAASSSLSAAPTSVEADGVTPATLTLLAKNASGKPLTGLTNASRLGFVLANGVAGVTIKAIHEVSNGTYQAQVTGDATAIGQAAKFVPTLDGKVVAGIETSVTFIKPVFSPTASTFTTSTQLLQADGQDTATLTIALQNQSHQPVSGLANQLTIIPSDPTGIRLSTIQEQGQSGIYTATLSGTSPMDALQLIAKYGDEQIAQPLVIKLSLDVDLQKTSLQLDRNSIQSDDHEQATLTFKALNKNNQPVTGLLNGNHLSLVQTSSVAGVKIGALQESPAGSYSAKVQGNTVGHVVLGAQIDGVAVSGKSVALELTPLQVDVDNSHTSLVVAPTSIEADGNERATLSFNAFNHNGQPLLGLDSTTLQFVDANHLADLTIEAVKPGAHDGEYIAMLHGLHAGQAKLQPLLQNQPVALSAVLTLLPKQLDPAQSTLTLTPNRIQADGVDLATLTFTPINKNGQAITGLSVSYRVTPNAAEVKIVPAVEDHGVYRATVSGTKAGSFELQPQIDGQPVAGMQASLTLEKLVPVANKSRFELSNATLPPDGVSTITATFTARNEHDLPVPLADLSPLVFGHSGVAGVSVTPVVDQGNGVYSAQVSGTQAGTATLVPVVAGTEMSALKQDLQLKALAPDAALSVLQLDRNSIESDDHEQATLTFKAINKNNQPVTGLLNGNHLSLVQTSSVAGLKIGALQESPAGSYSAKVQGNTVGHVVLGVKIDGVAVSGKSVALELTPLQVDVDNSHTSLVVAPTSIEADGNERATLTFNAFNHDGLPLRGLDSTTLQFVDANHLADLTIEAVKPGAHDGEYIAMLHGLHAGQAKLQPLLQNQPVALSAELTLLPKQLDPAQSTLKLTPNKIQADGVDLATLTFTPMNKNGQAITGLSVSYRVTPNAAEVKIVPAVEDHGVYRATVSGTKAGSFDLQPQIDGQPVAGMQASLTLEKMVPVANKSRFELSNAILPPDGVSTITATFTARNENDQPVQLADLSPLVFGHSGVAGLSMSPVVDQGNGVYSAQVSGTQAGTATLVPVVAGSEMSELKQDLQLKPLTPDAGHSVFRSAQNTIEADNTDSATLSFSAFTSDNRPVLGLGDQLQFKIMSTLSGVTLSKISESNGVYSATLRGSTPGLAQVLAMVNGGPMGMSVQVHIDPLKVSDLASTISVDPDTIEADDKSLAKLTLTARNKNGFLITGESDVHFVLTGGAGMVHLDPTVAQADGVYTSAVHGAVEALVYVTPFHDIYSLNSLRRQITLTGLKIDATQSKFEIAPTFKTNSQDTLTVTLKNANGVAIVGKTIKVKLGNSSATLGAFTDNQDGTYSAQLSDSIAEDIPLEVSVNNQTINTPDGQSSTVVHSEMP